jgi:hypothetical protein
MRGKALCFHGEQGQIRVGKIDRCHKGICIYFVFKTHVCMHASAKDVRPESSMTWRLIGSLWYVDTIRMVTWLLALDGVRVVCTVCTDNRFLPTRNILMS